MDVAENDNDCFKTHYSFFKTNVARVEGAAEIIVEPDLVEFLFKVESRKDNAEDAKHSVTKRVDYLVQIVKNSHLKGEMTVTTKRRLVHSEEHFFMTGEVLVQCNAEEKYEDIINIIVEKLESGVTISEPHFFHSSKCIQEGRQKALKMAVNNARAKVMDIALSSGQLAGHALYVEERENHLGKVKLLTGSLGSSFSKQRFEQSQEIRSSVIAIYELTSVSKSQ